MGEERVVCSCIFQLAALCVHTRQRKTKTSNEVKRCGGDCRASIESRVRRRRMCVALRELQTGDQALRLRTAFSSYIHEKEVTTLVCQRNVATPSSR